MAYKQDFYEDTQDSKLSKINSAGLINLRLNNLWNDANQHSRNGQYARWNSDLDALWRELSSDTKDGDDNDKKFTELNNSIAKFGSLVGRQVMVGFGTITDKVKNNMGKQYLALMNKEIFLRRLMNDQGKGTAYLVGDEDYMDS